MEPPAYTIPRISHMPKTTPYPAAPYGISCANFVASAQPGSRKLFARLSARQGCRSPNSTENPRPAAPRGKRMVAVQRNSGSVRHGESRNRGGAKGLRHELIFPHGGMLSLCRRPFRLGPHAYDGRYVPSLKITICQNCESANWDGIVPRSHPRLLEHMKANGIEVRLNKKRCIDIPPIGRPQIRALPKFDGA
jgi:hypothetical protein